MTSTDKALQPPNNKDDLKDHTPHHSSGSRLIRVFSLLEETYSFSGLEEWTELVQKIDFLLEWEDSATLSQSKLLLHSLSTVLTTASAQNTGAVYNCLGVAHALLNNHTLAVSHFRKSLVAAHYASHLTPDALSTIKINLAEAYRLLADALDTKGSRSVRTERNVAFFLSKQLFSSILEQRENGFGHEHPCVGESYCRLGRHLVRGNEYDMANLCFTRAMQIFRRNSMDGGLDFAVVLTCMGELYTQKTMASQALQYYDMALGILEPALGKQHRLCRLTRHASDKLNATKTSSKDQPLLPFHFDSAKESFAPYTV